MPQPFRIVFICSGNQVRSPTAAALCARLTEGLPVEIDSAGTLGIEGVAPPPEAVETAASYGLDISEHRSKGLARAGLSSADLVIGFERGHVASAVVEAGARDEVTFTLPELSRLLAHQDAAGSVTGSLEDARRLIGEAHIHRRTVREFVPGEGVVDPIGRPRHVYEAAAAEIAGLLERVVRALFGR